MQDNTEKRTIFFHLAAILLFILLIITVYHAIRPGLGRLTADFFYPYLRSSAFSAIGRLPDI